MMIRRLQIPFENQMTNAQSILGWIYLLAHVAVLPTLLELLERYTPDPLTEATANLIYYGIGIVFCLTVMFTFLRRGFDRLADNLRLCIGTMLLALMVDYALSGAAALLLLLIDGVTENPNNATAIESGVLTDGTLKAVTIFLVPIVEETLFRGVVFGSVRTRSRVWAYAVSVVGFSLYHIWPYFTASGNPAMLLYALQYLPISVVLAWIYERSGCLWTNIFFHMGINALSLCVLSTAQGLGL